MSQTRFESVVETVVEMSIGLAINVTLMFTVLPLLGVQNITGQASAAFSLLATFVALGRKYCVRRFFNWWKYHRNSRRDQCH